MIEDSSHKFSPSKLATYRECPQRYKFRYIDGLKRAGQSVEQFLGTAVHQALETLYEGLLKGRTLSSEQTAAVFDGEWEKGFSSVLPGPGGIPHREEWAAVGRQCVTNYHRQYHPFDQDSTVGLERRIGFPIEVEGKAYPLEGFIDRLALSKVDGAFEIHDYKTAKTLPAQAYVDQDWQLGLYEIAVRHQWPDTRDVRLKWHYVRHGLTLTSARSASQLADLKAEAGALIGQIKRDHEFSARESALCGWCEFRAVCPLFSHGEKLAARPVELRSLDEGRAAVDELSALEDRRRILRAQIKEIEAEEEGVKQRLIDYAAKTGHQVVSGTHDEAVTALKEEIKFPTKTHSPQRLAELEKELLETPLWRHISHFDAHRFLEGWKAKAWSPQWQRLAEGVLERYAQRTAEAALRLRRRRDADD